MIPPKTKEILDLVVSICSIVSCIAAVYGVFKVVEFVVEVRPIIIPVVQEVKEKNIDIRKIISGTTIRHDTVYVIHKDTIYLPQDTDPQTDKGNPQPHPGKSANHVSEQERQKIEKAERNYRKRMKEMMKSPQTNP